MVRSTQYFGTFVSSVAFALLGTALAHSGLADEAGAPAEMSFRGRIVFFGNTNREGHSLVETMDFDGGGLHTVLELEKDQKIMPGRISPDGKQLAFVVDLGPGARPALWVLSADGQRQTLIEDAGVIAGGVGAWSPDGKRIAYTQRNDNEEYENLIVEVASRRVQRLEATRGGFVNDWSPDGESLSVTDVPEKESDRSRSLYMIKADGARIGLLTRNPKGDFLWGRFSPDGRHVVYREGHSRGGKFVVSCVVANHDGLNPRELFCFSDFTEGLRFAPEAPPCWSLDGKTIIWRVFSIDMATGRVNSFELLFAAAEGAAPRRLPLGGEREWWGEVDCR